MRLPALLVVAIGSASLAACLNSPNNFFDAGGNDAGGGTGTGVAGDLPCDVAAVITNNCLSCHAGSSPQGSVSLVSYADLTGPSPADPGSTVLARSLVRMRDATSPMPPTGMLADADIAVLQAWSDAGAPKGDCGSTPPPTDPVCTSGATWTGGCEASKDMHPGFGCIGCHTNPGAQPGCDVDPGEPAPTLGVAGTVFSTLREKDDCYATDVSGATVVITDANNQKYTLPVRGYGNFYLEEIVPAFPIRAEVQMGGKTAAMKDAVDTGDCNTCHTVMGSDGAPGRIVPPN